MMRLRVIALSSDKKDPLLLAAEDYLARAGRRMSAGLVLLSPARRKKGMDDARLRVAEGEALLAASQGSFRIALDSAGEPVDTPAFARRLEDALGRSKAVSFLVGGATGLADDVKNAADACLSLSPLTFPHRLAVLVVAEQVYRAAELARGGPYAK